AVLRGAVVPRADPRGQDLVWNVVLVLELGAGVVVDHRGVGAVDGGVARVVFAALTGGVAVDPLEPAVEASDRAALGSQQLLGEARQRHAEIVRLDESGREAG